MKAVGLFFTRVSEEKRGVKDKPDRMEKKVRQVIQAEVAEMEKMGRVVWMERLAILEHLDSQAPEVRRAHKASPE